MTSIIDISVTFGNDDQLVTIRKSNTSSPIIAGLLGVDTDANMRPIRIYLRSKIHSDHADATSFTGWEPLGAITTVLTKLGGEQ